MADYITFPLKDGSEFTIDCVEGEHFEEMFPNINVPQQFCAMKVWLECNPDRRKTKRGIRRFIAHWLIEATNRIEPPASVRREARVGASPRT